MASSGARVSLATFDQILSSLSNVVVLICAAHAFDPIGFGNFSLVVMVYTVAQVVVRGLISTTVVVHPEDVDHRRGAIVSATLLMGCLLALGCFAGAALLWAADSALALPIVVFGLAVPLLTLHDVGRYMAIARLRPQGAVVIDTVWLVLVVPAILLAGGSLVALVAAWVGSGALAAVWVFVQAGPPTRGGIAWLRERWSFSWRAAVSGLVGSATVLVMATLMAVVSSAAAVAAFRAASLLAAPSSAMEVAVATSVAADIAREREDAKAVRRHMRRAVLVSTALAMVNLVVLVFLPDFLGRALLGESWYVVAPLMLAVCLRVLFMAAQSGVRASLVGRRRIQVAMVTDIISIVLVAVCMVVGAALGDASGALWAMAVGTAVCTVCWWIALWWAEAHPLPDDPDDPDDSDEPDAPVSEPVTEPAEPAEPVARSVAEADVRPGRHRAAR